MLKHTYNYRHIPIRGKVQANFERADNQQPSLEGEAKAAEHQLPLAILPSLRLLLRAGS
jgi:hypothetical protein